MATFGTFSTDGERDYRGRMITFKNGERIKHKPTKPLDHCFDVQNITWEAEIIYNEKVMKPGVGMVNVKRSKWMLFSSGRSEAIVRKSI